MERDFTDTKNDSAGSGSLTPSDLENRMHEELIVQVNRLTNNLIKAAGPGSDSLRGDCLELRRQAEKTVRHYQIVHPEWDSEFGAALYWIHEQGDSSDLIALLQAKTRGDVTEDQMKLLEWTIATISQRTSQLRTLRKHARFVRGMFVLCVLALAVSLINLSHTWFGFALAFGSGTLAYECLLILSKIKIRAVPSDREDSLP